MNHLLEVMENVRLSTEIIALKQQATQLNLMLLSMQKSYDQVTLAYLKTQAESKQANAIVSAQTKQLDKQGKQIDSLIAQNEMFKEHILLLTARLYGKSSEKFTNPDDRQGWLFDEATDDAFDQIKDTEEETVTETRVPEHTRIKKRGKREPLPEYLPRERIVHELPQDELVGANGEQYVVIGEEITEQLDVIPQQIFIWQHVRLKYAVAQREELGIKIAALPQFVLPKSNASSGLLAHITQAKFCHHLPLYRQEQIWKQLEISLPRNSMCRWLAELGEKVQPVVDEVFEQMKLLPYIQADETTVAVVNEKTQPQKSSHNGYMWVYNNTAGTIYDYQPNREGINAKNMLDEFKGYVQSDAYGGYNLLFTAESGRISVGCWAHARRKFVEVSKVLDGADKNRKKDSHADQMIKLIAGLYKIEAECKELKLTKDQVTKVRQDQALPILTDIKKKLDEWLLSARPSSALGKAIAYSLNNWQALTRYVEHGQVPIDNNDTERKVKPFVIGRKNWLFAGNTRGAKASANLYSLIESAKAHDLKVFEYLKYVYDHLGSAESDKDYEALTPQFVREKCPDMVVGSRSNKAEKSEVSGTPEKNEATPPAE